MGFLYHIFWKMVTVPLSAPNLSVASFCPLTIPACQIAGCNFSYLGGGLHPCVAMTGQGMKVKLMDDTTEACEEVW